MSVHSFPCLSVSHIHVSRLNGSIYRNMLRTISYTLLSWFFFRKNDPPHLFTIRLVLHCAAILATAELLFIIGTDHDDTTHTTCFNVCLSCCNVLSRFCCTRVSWLMMQFRPARSTLGCVAVVFNVIVHVLSVYLTIAAFQFSALWRLLILLTSCVWWDVKPYSTSTTNLLTYRLSLFY